MILGRFTYIGNGQLQQITMKDIYNTLDCIHDKQAVLTPEKSPRRYIVRRLTPTECARLQGFPDWWCADLKTENPSDDEIELWKSQIDEWRIINGKCPVTRAQVIKWLQNPESDTAQYKLWGNGVALPCVQFILSGIVKQQEFVLDGQVA